MGSWSPLEWLLVGKVTTIVIHYSQRTYEYIPTFPPNATLALIGTREVAITKIKFAVLM